LKHPSRSVRQSFLKGKTIKKGQPKRKFREDILKTLDDPKESENGVFKVYSENHNWTHKSFLWELSYAKALILPHNIDLMHQEWNIVENIMSMCLDVTGFMKNNMNVREDLAALYDHPLQKAKTNAKGNLSRPKAPYCLKPTERKEVLKWLRTLKFLDHHATNIKRALNFGTGKLNGLKSHNYHIFIERLMLVMFCGYFKADLWKMFVELSYFYRQICAKQISKAMMQKFKKEIAVVVCKMKKVFPSGWFNAMQHLLMLYLGKIWLEDLWCSDGCIVKKEN
jgi:hypothetical protein